VPLYGFPTGSRACSSPWAFRGRRPAKRLSWARSAWLRPGIWARRKIGRPSDHARRVSPGLRPATDSVPAPLPCPDPRTGSARRAPSVVSLPRNGAGMPAYLAQCPSVCLLAIRERVMAAFLGLDGVMFELSPRGPSLIRPRVDGVWNASFAAFGCAMPCCELARRSRREWRD
jgi:hypothetical protein